MIGGTVQQRFRLMFHVLRRLKLKGFNGLRGEAGVTGSGGLCGGLLVVLEAMVGVTGAEEEVGAAAVGKSRCSIAVTGGSGDGTCSW